jgi:hypothetical protein
MAVFWVIVPCSVVEVYRCFRSAYVSIIREIIVNFYQTTRLAVFELLLIVASYFNLVLLLLPKIISEMRLHLFSKVKGLLIITDT